MNDSVEYLYEREQLDNIPEQGIDNIKPLCLPSDKKFHVFVLYIADFPDRDIAIKIDQMLHKKGYECCLHERDFNAGELIVDNIAININRSVKVVFLLSEKSKSSAWCEFEMAFTEGFHIQNKGYKPIIIKLDDCKLPDRLERYTYLAADSPVENWINRLAKAINNQTDYLTTSIKDIKFVALPCIHYNRGKVHSIADCRYPHVCVKHIMGDETCDMTCGKNHHLVTEQSRGYLVHHGFITDVNEDILLEKYREECKKKLEAMPEKVVTGPCCYYNHEGCLFGELRCPFTHICKEWFLGKCFNQSCEFSHDILNNQTKHLLEIFKVDITQSKDEILDKYREKYPHKIFIKLPARKTSTRKLLQDHLWYVVGITALIMAFAVPIYHKLEIGQ